MVDLVSDKNSRHLLRQNSGEIFHDGWDSSPNFLRLLTPMPYFLKQRKIFPLYSTVTIKTSLNFCPKTEPVTGFEHMQWYISGFSGAVVGFYADIQTLQCPSLKSPC